MVYIAADATNMFGTTLPGIILAVALGATYYQSAGNPGGYSDITKRYLRGLLYSLCPTLADDGAGINADYYSPGHVFLAHHVSGRIAPWLAPGYSPGICR